MGFVVIATAEWSAAACRRTFSTNTDLCLCCLLVTWCLWSCCCGRTRRSSSSPLHALIQHTRDRCLQTKRRVYSIAAIERVCMTALRLDYQLLIFLHRCWRGHKTTISGSTSGFTTTNLVLPGQVRVSASVVECSRRDMLLSMSTALCCPLTSDDVDIRGGSTRKFVRRSVG